MVGFFICMKSVDYIIVGQGLAGSAVAQRLIAKGLHVLVIDNPSPNQASRIASGIYNPVVLKRMKKVWQADNMLAALYDFYAEAATLIGKNIHLQTPVQRVFAHPKEADEWLILADSPRFAGILGGISTNKNSNIHAPFGLGEVAKSGRIDTAVWLDGFAEMLLNRGLLLQEKFEYQTLQIDEKALIYKEWKARGIIFCEGAAAQMANPFFGNLPFAPTKGEVLHVNVPDLQTQKILHGSVFTMPLNEDLCKIGATYNWHDLNFEVTKEAAQELQQKAAKYIKANMSIAEQWAGIRPTVRDRKPLLGTHKIHRNVHIFNGMGSRGVLMAPWLSKIFTEYLLERAPLPPEVDIARFD